MQFSGAREHFKTMRFPVWENYIYFLALLRMRGWELLVCKRLQEIVKAKMELFWAKCTNRPVTATEKKSRNVACGLQLLLWYNFFSYCCLYMPLDISNSLISRSRIAESGQAFNRYSNAQKTFKRTWKLIAALTNYVQSI